MCETNSPHIYLCLRIGLIALIDVQMEWFLQTDWYSVNSRHNCPLVIHVIQFEKKSPLNTIRVRVRVRMRTK